MFQDARLKASSIVKTHIRNKEMSHEWCPPSSATQVTWTLHPLNYLIEPRIALEESWSFRNFGFLRMKREIREERKLRGYHLSRWFEDEDEEEKAEGEEVDSGYEADEEDEGEEESI